MKTNYTVANNGYLMFNGELRKVNFTKIIGRGEDIYYTTDDPEVGEIKNAVTYASVKDFEKGNTGSHNVTCVPFPFTIVDGLVKAWTMRDGEPVCDSLDTQVDLDRRRICPILPEGYYASREDCLKNNTYIEVGENGERIEHEGILKKVALDPDQREFMRDLAGMIKKAKDLGIFLALDISYGDIYAINERKFPNGLDCDCCGEMPDSFYLNDLENFNTYIPSYSEDSYLYERK